MLSSSYDNSGTGISYCPVLIILISKRCYKPVVLSEGREREDLNLTQNVFSEHLPALRTRKLPVPLKGMIFWRWTTYFISVYLDLILKEKSLIQHNKA